MPAIALLAPTSMESEELSREIMFSPDNGPGFFLKGRLYGKPIIFSHCGVGKVNAAHCTTIILEQNNIDILILFGIGGSYSAAGIGDIALAESESYGEEGIMTYEGWKTMEYVGFPLLKKESEYFNTFPMDGKLLQLALDVSREIGLNTFSGHFITVSQCSGTQASGETMKMRFNGLCENMEGAAVAHICAMYGVPMVEIRGISNIITDRKKDKWDISLAASHCNRLVLELLKRLL